MSRMYTFLGVIATLMAVALSSGCVSPSASSPESIRRALNVDTTSSVEEYRLGPTDVVEVSVWRNEDLSTSVPVRPDGKISVPLVGDIHASGKTPESLANDIEKELASFIRQPQVSVVVTSMGSHEFSDRVRVTGAVQQPMSMPHRAGMTVLDVFLEAGGANQFASLNSSMLYRKAGGEVVVIPVRLGDIINRGDIGTNYSLRPGDIISVPERKF
ncbi:hypothetical protein GCM10009113_04190 [Marinobacter szutsaonensis]